jgi:hypothetical protein
VTPVASERALRRFLLQAVSAPLPAALPEPRPDEAVLLTEDRGGRAGEAAAALGAVEVVGEDAGDVEVLVAVVVVVADRDPLPVARAGEPRRDAFGRGCHEARGNVLVGGPGNDRLVGTAGRDRIDGGSGSDTLDYTFIDPDGNSLVIQQLEPDGVPTGQLVDASPVFAASAADIGLVWGVTLDNANAIIAALFFSGLPQIYSSFSRRNPIRAASVSLTIKSCAHRLQYSVSSSPSGIRVTSWQPLQTISLIHPPEPIRMPQPYVVRRHVPSR